MQKKSDYNTYKKLKSHRLNTTAAIVVTTQMLKLIKHNKRSAGLNYRSEVIFFTSICHAAILVTLPAPKQSVKV